MLRPTRAALLRFARVLERRGDDAGDVYLRAAVATPPLTSDDREAALRTLIDVLARRGEHDVLDALRPEVEQSFRVGDVFARALATRGSLDAVDSYVRAQAQHWEHCTRLEGALASLVTRGDEGLRLVRAWLELPPYGANAETWRAHLWAQSRLGQAAAWLGDEASARRVMTLLEAEVSKPAQFDAMTGKYELAPLCAAMGEVPRASALLREAEADWDAHFDEDIDGYGRLSRNAILSAVQRVKHLEAQLKLPLAERRWGEPPVRRPYVPSYSSRDFWRAHRRYDLEALLADQKLDEALEFLREPREGSEWATYVRMVASAVDTPERCDRLVEVHRRLPTSAGFSNWSAWSAADVCGALARNDRAEAAFGIAAAVSDFGLLDRPNARLACAEGVISRRRTHALVRPALETLIAELSPKAVGDQTDVFTTPVSLAELLLPLA